MNVANRKYIRHLSMKSMKAARARNTIAILAIALTTVLFTSLFTIGLSINHSIQQANFRQLGGWSHGDFKNLTRSQFDTLKADPLIKQYGLRRFAGMASGAPFQKSHVEIGYSDANNAHWMFCDPVEGRLPAEGTNEAATDTRVLGLLGVEPVLGNTFTLTLDSDGTEVTETFTLSGWWEYDGAMAASHVLLPQSRVQAVYDQVGIGQGIGRDGITGSWNMSVMLGSSLNIEQDLMKILERNGYQNRDRTISESYVPVGVNWGYTGAQFSDSVDPVTVLAVVALLFVIMLTGYLIIYNVFQISVTNDIRFYGLLKTIGTTGRQVKRLIRWQALALSGMGIPLGLLVGYGVGIKLTPVILARLDGTESNALSSSPLIFIGSALFALVTVIISCRRPGRLAAGVSPVEAVRYTEGKTGGKPVRRVQAGASLFKMAYANLGRSKSKTVITVISLSMAILLLNITVTFTNSFDMDKYLSGMASDFIVSDAVYFQTGAFWSEANALPESALSQIEARPGIEGGGRVYGRTAQVEEFITEDYYRVKYGKWNDVETLNHGIGFAEKNEEGLLAESVELYGMEPFILNRLHVLQGDLARLQEPGGRYIAAVYNEDDYGNPLEDSHWARLGDKVTLRYVEEYEFYDPDTGKILDPLNIPGDQPYRYRAKSYEDREYEVAALVVVPNFLSYRYYGNDQFVMNDQTFMKDTGTNSVLYYACDMDDNSMDSMEAFLSELTEHRMTQLDYESKATYATEFYAFRDMFLLLGGVLSFIVGLVGVLNFLNAVLTGILTRRREFAMLQAVGMTGRQLKTMLIYEGLGYAFGAVGASLILCLAFAPVLSRVLESVAWFFTYRFSLLSILLPGLVFAAFGIALPLLVYRAVSRRSVVERLREAE